MLHKIVAAQDSSDDVVLYKRQREATMALKKQNFGDDEVAIFDEAVIYKRAEYWHFRMWLEGERKYVRLSLKTRNKATAIDKGKNTYHQILANKAGGKTYFSLTAAEGVNLYVSQRAKDVAADLIVRGRLGTIKTHLQHWVDFIGKSSKLKEMERADCENYFHGRIKTNKGLPVSQSTIQNEQSTINAMMGWLYKRGEANIKEFDFAKLPRIDRSDESLRRSSFTAKEVADIQSAIPTYIAEAAKNLDDTTNVSKVLAGYYILIASITGLRTGEQRQLKWGDIRFEEVKKDGMDVSLVKISVRAETSKVRKQRTFFVRDRVYFDDFLKITSHLYPAKTFGKFFLFSYEGNRLLSERTILLHFKKILELAQIEKTDKRDLVPYSLRHHFITSRIKAGLSFQQVAEQCGTSATQIERTYYHIDEDIMRTNALADYTVSDEGQIIPR